MNSKLFVTVIVASCASLLPAQEPAKGDAISKDVKGMYTATKNNILKAADRMPEENYSFKPVDSVRSYGQIVAHVADAQYLFCSADRGEKKAGEVEKTKTTKADIVAALKEAFDYCDASYDGLTDAKLADPISFFGQQRTRAGVLTTNSAHNFEHYGNMVTYLRIKGLTPPSSDPRPPKKK